MLSMEDEPTQAYSLGENVTEHELQSREVQNQESNSEDIGLFDMETQAYGLGNESEVI